MPKKRLGVSSDLIADIGASVSEMSDNAGELDYRLIEVTLIDRDPDQPRDLAFVDPAKLPELPTVDANDPNAARKSKALDGLRELAGSVAEKGVLEAIEVYLVGNRFALVFGERRWLASRMAGRSKIPARVLARRPDDLAERQGIENLQREDLSLVEQLRSVRSIRAAYAERSGDVMSQQAFSKATGISKSHTSTMFGVCDAPEDVAAAVETGRLTDLVKAGVITRMPTAEAREGAIAAAMEGASREALRERAAEGKGGRRSKVGRPATRVSFGHTDNPAAVRRLFVEVLGERRVARTFVECDWADPRQVTRAWQQFWSEFEATDAK